MTARDIEIVGVSKAFGENTVVDDLDLTIGDGEFFSLLGPSGCGKTTTLRMVAGFERPTTGSILLGGTDITHQAPAKRPLNMVFQDYALFPHLTVADNVAFGLKVKRLGKEERTERVAGALDDHAARPACPSAGRPSSPVASASGSRWPGRWSTGRTRSCSTSRSAPSTSSCARRCRPS